MTTSTSATIPELYETLAAGAKFRLAFTCKAEAEHFRQRLANTKYRSEKSIKSLGIPLDKMILTMEFDSLTNTATYFLRPPEVQRFEILELIPPTPPTTT